MSEEKSHQPTEDEQELEPDEVEKQDGELLPDREALSIVDPLRGPMPLSE
jgi:hypothetical protein